MKKHFKIMGVATAMTGAVLALRVRAAEVPATPSISYSGYLEDAGVPVEGTRQVGVTLWKANSTANPQDEACAQAEAATAVTGGWFTLALDEPCIAALRAFPSLFLEFSVDGVAFPLQPIGAVPYALRALEFNSGSRLRRVVVRGADGSKQDDPTRWWDSERQEECTFNKVGNQLICAPKATPLLGSCSGGSGANVPPGWYTDDTCQILANVVTTSYAYTTPPKYVPSSTASSGLALPGPMVQLYRGCGFCSTVLQDVYPPKTDIDASEFVAGEETHD